MSKLQEYTDTCHWAGGLPDLQAVKIIEELEAEVERLRPLEEAIKQSLSKPAWGR